MPLSDKDSHLSSDDHKNRTRLQLFWCEDCGKYISDKTRHFQSDNQLQKNQQRKYSQDNDMRSTSGVKTIVNEKTYMKFEMNPNVNNLDEYPMNELLSKKYFSRYKYQLSYLTKYTKLINGEEHKFHKWVKSDFNYNHYNDSYSIHNTSIQNLDDEQLEGSGFQIQEIEEGVLKIYNIKS